MKKIVFLLSFVFANLMFADISLADGIKKVFIVASYEENHICGGPQEEGAVKGLNKEGWFEGINVEVSRYYMDTKRKNITRESMKKQGEIVLEKINKFHPDVVITIDDNAFREVGMKLVGRDDVSVVFAGLNGFPEMYNEKKHFMESRCKLTGNVTGVYEKLYVSRSLRVMLSAIPSLANHKVVGITDFSPTGNALTKQLNDELKTKPANVKWELKRTKNWQEYTALIKQLNEDDDVKAIYPMSLLLKDGDKVYTAPEIFKWTLKHSTKPEMALNYFFSKIGLFGGAAVDFKAMGYLSGKQAGRILNGEEISKIHIENAPDYAIVFNVKRAEELGIKIPMPLLTAADHIYK